MSTTTRKRRFFRCRLKLPLAVVEDIQKRADREHVQFDWMFSEIIREQIAIAESALAKQEVAAD